MAKLRLYSWFSRLSSLVQARQIKNVVPAPVLFLCCWGGGGRGVTWIAALYIIYSSGYFMSHSLDLLNTLIHSHHLGKNIPAFMTIRRLEFFQSPQEDITITNSPIVKKGLLRPNMLILRCLRKCCDNLQQYVSKKCMSKWCFIS